MAASKDRRPSAARLAAWLLPGCLLLLALPGAGAPMRAVRLTPAPTHAAYLPSLQGFAPTPTATVTPTATPTSTPTSTPTVTPTGAPTPRRAWPDTTTGIHVFNDQLPGNMSDTLWHFAATHYAGTQKMTRPDADRLRAIDPDFLILHYRLGPGLGYRSLENGCQPTGEELRIVEGDEWVVEWPGDGAVQERWFFHWPEASSTRVLQCDWGWYLMNLDDAAYRTWWQEEVLRQLQANDDDGLFLDSLSVPNYLGGDRYDPALPPLDAAFEAAWAARIEQWLAWLQGQPAGAYAVIPNAGAWITTRDPTDYSDADGVMIESFALWGEENHFALEDWKLQMNRALALVAQEKVIIGQSYVTGAQARRFALGSYLLIKGNRTFINLELDFTPEWWPEYEIPIGAPVNNAGTDVDSLLAGGVYRRQFTAGFVLVNPGEEHVPVDLGSTFYLAEPAGGGEVPEDGVPTGTVHYRAVTAVEMAPFSGAILLDAAPGG